MAVPEQVRKQTEAVQKLYEDLNEDGTPSPEEGEGTPSNVEPIVPADSVPEGAPQPGLEEPAPGGEEDFEQKYLTLQGMFNAEVPRLTAENAELGARLGQMEQLIATMQTAPAPTPEPEPETPASSLTADELEEYGESIDIMRKVSQEVAGAYQGQIANLQATIQQLQGSVIPRVEQIGAQQAQTAEQMFWSDLSLAVPEWKAINDNQDFQTWLLEVDPLTGYSKQAFLDSAQQSMDVNRVAGFFTSWQQAAGTPQAQPNRSASDSELEQQVAPGRSRGSNTPKGNQPVTYTPADITAFFDDVRKGAYKGKEEERDKLERDIFAAQAEGRIINA
jgi:hypothetical protein